jgi:preprotein translocase subunit SecG
MQMVVKIVVITHITVSVALILAIMLHSGSGTGLSTSFGGGLPSTFSGSSMIERNLDRITIALTVIFILTSVVLYVFFRP